MKKRRLLSLLVASPFAARAQGHWAPDKPIKLVVPFAAGGSTDITARLLAQALGDRLGQAMVIENRPGAGGNIGAEAVARAVPDGQTLFMATSGVIGANKALYRSLPFDPVRDFAPISQVAFVPNILVVGPSMPATSIADLIARVKARPGEVTYGSAGIGTSQHMAGALFAQRAGLSMIHVPYRGGAPANTDLVSGKIDFIMSPLVEVLPQIRAGTLKPLAVTTLRRSPLFPDVPTIAETMPGFEVALWSGLMAPAGTPMAAVQRLAMETAAALRTPALRDKLAEQGSEPVGSNPEDFASFIQTDIPKWTEIVRLSGATAD